jgi:hypothetical protein
MNFVEFSRVYFNIIYHNFCTFYSYIKPLCPLVHEHGGQGTQADFSSVHQCRGHGTELEV